MVLKMKKSKTASCNCLYIIYKIIISFKIGLGRILPDMASAYGTGSSGLEGGEAKQNEVVRYVLLVLCSK